MSVHVVNDYADRTTILFIKVSPVHTQKLMTNVDDLSLKLKEKTSSWVYCPLGWANLYKIFEIEKYTFCGKLILPKKMETHLKKIFLAQLV